MNGSVSTVSVQACIRWSLPQRSWSWRGSFPFLSGGVAHEVQALLVLEFPEPGRAVVLFISYGRLVQGEAS